MFKAVQQMQAKHGLHVTKSSMDTYSNPMGEGALAIASPGEGASSLPKMQRPADYTEHTPDHLHAEDKIAFPGGDDEKCIWSQQVYLLKKSIAVGGDPRVEGIGECLRGVGTRGSAGRVSTRGSVRLSGKTTQSDFLPSLTN